VRVAASFSKAALAVVALGPALVAVYLGGLTAAALFGRKRRPPPSADNRRFAILIPAHNEEALIGRLLANLLQLNYPRQDFDVHVVADNCDDRTAEVARANGAQVYERTDLSEQAKGYALRWLIEQMDVRAYDAFVVLDADTVVAANFLDTMNAHLAAGSQVIQAYYSVLNAGESPVAALRHGALAAIHYLRPLGRAALGLSCGLKGNGMCFAAPVLKRFPWQWFTLAEDVEFHLALVRAGVRVDFAPETFVAADMPVSLAQAASQNARWERGRLRMVQDRVPALLAESLRRRDPVLLDAVAEQLIPPLSVPFALSGLCLVASVALRAKVPAALSIASMAIDLGYLLAGLALVRAPRSTYVALTYAPMYVAWKVGVYAKALISARRAAWVRTARVQ
jgi:1,2-diacylglycerol 3-beta-glucosyltransferase